ncbi:hypothetical protein M478_261 [Yersinia pestis 2944]|nr:hypothetical protein M478_261 [Yersinia pestis 2944]
MKILKRLIFICLVIIIIFFLSIAVCKRWQRGETGIQGQISGHIICIQTKILGLPQGQLNLIILYLQLRTGVSQEKVVLSIGMMFVYLTLKIISLP